MSSNFGDFILFMSGGKKLLNNQGKKGIKFIHPLTYSGDNDRHKDMRLIPAWIKYSRESLLYENLKKVL